MPLPIRARSSIRRSTGGWDGNSQCVRDRCDAIDLQNPQVNAAFPDPKPASTRRGDFDQSEGQPFWIAREKRRVRVREELTLARDRLPNQQRDSGRDEQDVRRSQHRVQTPPPKERMDRELRDRSSMIPYQ